MTALRDFPCGTESVTRETQVRPLHGKEGYLSLIPSMLLGRTNMNLALKRNSCLPSFLYLKEHNVELLLSN